MTTATKNERRNRFTVTLTLKGDKRPWPYWFLADTHEQAQAEARRWYPDAQISGVTLDMDY